jgi:uncharacterized protein (DUF1501 family)
MALARKVVILTMTEFGRMLQQNGSGGTDHGHASCLFVLGGPVNGGKVYGSWPGLAPEQLHRRTLPQRRALLSPGAYGLKGG